MFFFQKLLLLFFFYAYFLSRDITTVEGHIKLSPLPQPGTNIYNTHNIEHRTEPIKHLKSQADNLRLLQLLWTTIVKPHHCRKLTSSNITFDSGGNRTAYLSHRWRCLIPLTMAYLIHGRISSRQKIELGVLGPSANKPSWSVSSSACPEYVVIILSFGGNYWGKYEPFYLNLLRWISPA